jgi:hypothetical protein
MPWPDADESAAVGLLRYAFGLEEDNISTDSSLPPLIAFVVVDDVFILDAVSGEASTGSPS